MQSENKFLEDISKLINGATGTLAGMGREAETNMKEKMREWMGGLDMVSREEFEAAKAIAIAAREKTEALEQRVAALEAAINAKSAG